MGRPSPALLVLLSALVPAGAAAAQSAPEPTVGTPIVLPYADPPPIDLTGTRLVHRQASARCDAEPVEPLYAEALAPRIVQATGEGDEAGDIPDEVIEFAVSADGRPGGIRSGAGPSPVRRTADPADVEASLSAWRFPPEARSNCRLTVTHQGGALGAADPILVARALALGQRAFAPRLRQALKRAGDTCDQRPGLRLAIAPDRRKLAPEPGGRGWVVVRAGVGDDGRTTDVEILDASSRSAADEGRRAVSETIFHPGSPAVGCMFSFARFGDRLPAAPLPDAPVGNQCRPEDAARLSAVAPAYPPGFLERGIEGWAVVRYDVASWGRVGGVEVLASEPAAAFGDSARQAYQAARATPAFDHVRGCVQRVRFRLPDERPPDDED